MKRSDIKRTPLADTVLTTLEPEDKEYRVHDGNGLYFRVTPTGNKSWQLRYKKSDGKWSFMGLGGYGNGSHQLTGKQAREKAHSILSASEEPGELITIKQKQQAEAMASEASFKTLAEEWLESKTAWVKGTRTRNLGALKKHVFPKFGHRPYVDITTMEWLTLLRGLEQAGIAEQTKRVRALCRDIYDLARVTGRIQHNPLEGLHKYLTPPKNKNYSHVSQDELPALLRAIGHYPHAPDVGIGLQLLSLLFCRPSELRTARWDEFNFQTNLWTIPAERTKKRREHVIPLPRQAVALLQQLQEISGMSPLLFVGRNNSAQPRSNTVFLMALRRLGYEGRQTAHGFRHIASTLLNEHGFNSDHIEAQLAHVKDGVAGVYNKAKYLEQRKVMMQWYADFLDALATDSSAS